LCRARRAGRHHGGGRTRVAPPDGEEGRRRPLGEDRGRARRGARVRVAGRGDGRGIRRQHHVRGRNAHDRRPGSGGRRRSRACRMAGPVERRAQGRAPGRAHLAGLAGASAHEPRHGPVRNTASSPTPITIAATPTTWIRRRRSPKKKYAPTAENAANCDPRTEVIPIESWAPQANEAMPNTSATPAPTTSGVARLAMRSVPRIASGSVITTTPTNLAGISSHANATSPLTCP